MSLTEFLHEYDLTLLIALGEHLRLVAISLLLSTLISVPLGVWIARRRRAAGPVLATTNLIQTIPSIALFGLMIPVLSVVNRGIGTVPAVIALVLYGLMPIVRNTYTALRQIPPSVLDAARGVGMTGRQILLRIELPLATSGIIAGIRTAATLGIGVAAIAAYIGAGGLGLVIERGLETNWETMTLVGAAGVALLALVVEIVLEILERLLTPTGTRVARDIGGRR